MKKHQLIAKKYEYKLKEITEDGKGVKYKESRWLQRKTGVILETIKESFFSIYNAERRKFDLEGLEYEVEIIKLTV